MPHYRDHRPMFSAALFQELFFSLIFSKANHLWMQQSKQMKHNITNFELSRKQKFWGKTKHMTDHFHFYDNGINCNQMEHCEWDNQIRKHGKAIDIQANSWPYAKICFCILHIVNIDFRDSLHHLNATVALKALPCVCSQWEALVVWGSEQHLRLGTALAEILWSFTTILPKTRSLCTNHRMNTVLFSALAQCFNLLDFIQ